MNESLPDTPEQVKQNLPITTDQTLHIESFLEALLYIGYTNLATHYLPQKLTKYYKGNLSSYSAVIQGNNRTNDAYFFLSDMIVTNGNQQSHEDVLSKPLYAVDLDWHIPDLEAVWQLIEQVGVPREQIFAITRTSSRKLQDTNKAYGGNRWQLLLKVSSPEVALYVEEDQEAHNKDKERLENEGKGLCKAFNKLAPKGFKSDAVKDLARRVRLPNTLNQGINKGQVIKGAVVDEKGKVIEPEVRATEATMSALFYLNKDSDAYTPVTITDNPTEEQEDEEYNKIYGHDYKMPLRIIEALDNGTAVRLTSDVDIHRFMVTCAMALGQQRQLCPTWEDAVPLLLRIGIEYCPVDINRGGLIDEDYLGAGRHRLDHAYFEAVNNPPKSNTKELPSMIRKVLPDRAFNEALLLECPGVVGDLTRWISSVSTVYQPVFAFAAALSGVAALCGRRIEYAAGEVVIDTEGNHTTKSRVMRLNTYCMCIGESSSGKEDPQQMMSQVFSVLGREKNELPIVRSDSGLLDALTAAGGRGWLVWDEFGKTLTAWASSKDTSHASKLIGMVNKIFSGGSRGIKNRLEDLIDARYLYLSIFFVTTRAGYLNSLQYESIEDGFMARLLTLPTNEPFRHRKPYRGSVECPVEILDRLQKIVDIDPEDFIPDRELLEGGGDTPTEPVMVMPPITNNIPSKRKPKQPKQKWKMHIEGKKKYISMTPEAEMLFNQRLAENDKQNDMLLGTEQEKYIPILRRREEKALRLAAVLSNLDNITEDVLAYAFKVIDEVMETTMGIVQKNVYATGDEKIRKQIIAYFEKRTLAGKPEVSLRVLYDYHVFKNTINYKALRQIVLDLVEAGQLFATGKDVWRLGEK